MNGERNESRPAIWARGSQTPPFDPRAFARTALKIGRETVAGILSRCGKSAESVGGELSQGRLRIPEDRLGRTGRYLPSAESTGRAVFGGAGILKRAAEVAQPNLNAYAPEEVGSRIETAYRDLFRTADQLAPQGDTVSRAAAPPQAPQDRAGADELASIRALMTASPAEVEPLHGSAEHGVADHGPANHGRTASHGAESASPGQADNPSLAGRFKEALHEGAARVIGYWMIVFAIPYGAVRAGIAHLKGEDLRRNPNSE
ncbi:hypothetical protein HOY34_09020 [Xinfangfangia sp. D13-10-4-6]|uniref:hypothetical protein n=1 Tax=Pseudogemmobacter hezensis TaxID=2737662 RepID=UPI001554067C|nr:hypothetical protein [Pseudogemmobacter hezensis]NPD15339.1 hypothetical protein [Pseudogemmobacter hezensis]